MKSILIIEDDPILSKAYSEKLSATYNLIYATDGQTGLAAAIGNHPDLIILDLILPGNDSGLTVLTKLKHHIETKNIPVIVITNIDNQGSLAHERGAVDYLIKANTDMNGVLKKITHHIG